MAVLASLTGIMWYVTVQSHIMAVAATCTMEQQKVRKFYAHPKNQELISNSDSGMGSHNVDNTAINSLTVTIVSVSIVSVALVAVLVYLLVFLLHRRRVTSPFKHRRMNDGSRPRSNNMEFANRMFLQDDDDVSDENGAFTMEELEPSTNFVNPVYETMFQVG